MSTTTRATERPRAGSRPAPTIENAARTHRRLWMGAGWLLIAYIAVTFAGVGFESSLLLGDKPSLASKALVQSSMTKNFTGGYIEFLATLIFLVGALLIAKLLRGPGVAGEWLSSCIAGSALVGVAITVAVGFSAGAAALYDGHHGASLATVTTVNDIRNFSFILTGGLYGVFALAIAAAVWLTGALPRWVSYSGLVVGVLYIGSIPAARSHFDNVSTMIGFVWVLALGVAALRNARRPMPQAAPPAAVTVA